MMLEQMDVCDNKFNVLQIVIKSYFDSKLGKYFFPFFIRHPVCMPLNQTLEMEAIEFIEILTKLLSS